MSAPAATTTAPRLSESAAESMFRDPTGLIPWPMLLLAGAEKAGKSWQAITSSMSDLVGVALYVEVGEGDADQYGRIPGVAYKIARHDGSYRSILAACEAAVAYPRTHPDKPNVVVLDSITELWDLITSEQQEVANRRRKSEDAPITMDQWNIAKRRWRAILKVLREHDGPVIITARLEQVTVMDANGKPTTEKEWKVRAEKNLGFEVSGIVQMPSFGEAYLTGVRTPVMPMTPGEIKRLPSDWNIDWLLRQLGLEEASNRGRREYVEPNAGAYAETAGINPVLAAQAIADKATLATDQASIAELRAQADDADLLNFDVTVDGNTGPLVHALRFLHTQAGARAQAQAPAQAEAVRAQPEPVRAQPDAQMSAQPEPVSAHTEPEPAPTQAPAPEAVRAPEPEPARAPAPAAAPAGAHLVFSAPVAGESRADKARRHYVDEVGYQADVLGVAREAYAAELVDEVGRMDALKPSKAQRFLVPRREQVIEVLREQGRATEAQAYEAIGIAFPVNLAVVFAEAGAQVATSEA